MNPVVVIPAFRRVESLRRLLSSLEAAEHPPGARLIISLEGGAVPEVREVAESFEPSGLSVAVIAREERLGLRDHVLACGDLALEHGAVIVLEDDLLVDRYYYEFAARALAAHAADPDVAGIALYGPEFNEFAALPFAPLETEWSTYPMQVPCSWGQAWSRDQWRGFRTWYDGHHEQGVETVRSLPQKVRSWPETSWKKYFAAYLVGEAKTFVYPYSSYATNCADPGGTHGEEGADHLQVRLPWQGRMAPDPRFGPVRGAAVAYDAFMEPCGSHVFEALDLAPEEVEMDLMGTKPVDLLREKPLAVTSKRTGRPLRTFPLRYRPLEQNLRFPQPPGRTGGLGLVETSSLREGAPPRRSLAELGFHAGMPLGSRGVARAVMGGLPAMLGRKLRSIRG